MADAFCRWWDCPLKDTAEFQQEDCNKRGWSCCDCPLLVEESTDEENE